MLLNVAASCLRHQPRHQTKHPTCHNIRVLRVVASCRFVLTLVCFSVDYDIGPMDARPQTGRSILEEGIDDVS